MELTSDERWPSYGLFCGEVQSKTQKMKKNERDFKY